MATTYGATGIDFSASSGAVFKGIKAVVYRLITNASGDRIVGSAGGPDWEISDDTESEIGTPLGSNSITEASGKFLFGETGYWLLSAQAKAATGTGTGQSQLQLYATDNNDAGGVISQSTIRSSADGNSSFSTFLNAFVKVDSTSLDKIWLYQDMSAGNEAFSVDTNKNYTSITFVKLGDL
jgi:hypothetical protein